MWMYGSSSILITLTLFPYMKCFNASPNWPIILDLVMQFQNLRSCKWVKINPFLPCMHTHIPIKLDRIKAFHSAFWRDAFWTQPGRYNVHPKVTVCHNINHPPIHINRSSTALEINFLILSFINYVNNHNQTNKWKTFFKTYNLLLLTSPSKFYLTGDDSFDP